MYRAKQEAADAKFRDDWALPPGWVWCDINRLETLIKQTHGSQTESSSTHYRTAYAIILAKRRSIRGRTYSSRNRDQQKNIPRIETDKRLLISRLRQDRPGWGISQARESIGIWLDPMDFPH